MIYFEATLFTSVTTMSPEMLEASWFNWAGSTSSVAFGDFDGDGDHALMVIHR